MNQKRATGGEEPFNTQEYSTLALLDELESLLEDLEVHGITGLEDAASIPKDLSERMAGLGVNDIQQVRDKLMRLHAQVDDDERDLTISDS